MVTHQTTPDPTSAILEHRGYIIKLSVDTLGDGFSITISKIGDVFRRTTRYRLTRTMYQRELYLCDGDVMRLLKKYYTKFLVERL